MNKIKNEFEKYAFIDLGELNEQLPQIRVIISNL